MTRNLLIFGFKDETRVAFSDGIEDCDAIDPGFLLDPTDMAAYGAVTEPTSGISAWWSLIQAGKTCRRGQAINIAIDCEAADLEYRDGWYYLLATHGTCCDGANSTYNIVVGRSRNVTGPYLDNMGRDMLTGGGKDGIGCQEQGYGSGTFRTFHC